MFEVILADEFSTFNADVGIDPQTNKHVVSAINDFADGQWRFARFQKFIWDNIVDTALSSAERNALANHEEQLRVARKYYRWAPLSRVYVCCHSQILKIFPTFLIALKIPVVFTAMLYCVARYLYLNKGVRKDDLMTINPDNIQKLFKTPMDRYRDL